MAKQLAVLAVCPLLSGNLAGADGIAVLLCPPTIRSFLINFARPFIFSTAISHTSLIALHSVWDILQSTEGDNVCSSPPSTVPELIKQRRSDLFSLIHQFHTLLDPVLRRIPPRILRYPPDLTHTSPFPAGLPDLASRPHAPIIGLLTSTPHALSAYLLEKGFIVRPVVPPTVPPGEERVRVCLRAGISPDVVQALVKAIEDWTRKAEGGASSQTAISLKAKL